MRIIDVKDGDAEYDRAFQLARQSFDRFEGLWMTPYQGTRNFLFKVCFEGTRRPIFLWLELVAIIEDAYRGQVFETTDELPDIHEGQVIEIERARALDWMVNDGGIVHGGFTLLVERRRLSGDKMSEFDDLLMAKEWVDL